MKKTYLVTGGAGFIGSNLVDQLISDGHNVIVVDNLSDGNIDYVNPSATLYVEDINKVERMIEILMRHKVDGVFHLAAIPRVVVSILNPIETNQSNITGTLSMLRACRVANVKNFVYSSSSSVYGEQDTHLMTEDMKTGPLSFYALQKLSGETYTMLFGELFDMKTVALRYFNVYGNRQSTKGEYALVIGKFLEQKKNGNPMTVYGDGSQTRSYTHITDVVVANILAMYYRENGIFNIGTPVETSVKQIAELLGGEIKYINPNPRGDFEEMRKAANIDKSIKLLGWEPQTTIEEGIDQLINNEKQS